MELSWWESQRIRPAQSRSFSARISAECQQSSSNVSYAAGYVSPWFALFWLIIRPKMHQWRNGGLWLHHNTKAQKVAWNLERPPLCRRSRDGEKFPGRIFGPVSRLVGRAGPATTERWQSNVEVIEVKEFWSCDPWITYNSYNLHACIHERVLMHFTGQEREMISYTYNIWLYKLYIYTLLNILYIIYTWHFIIIYDYIQLCIVPIMYIYNINTCMNTDRERESSSNNSHAVTWSGTSTRSHVATQEKDRRNPWTPVRRKSVHHFFLHDFQRTDSK